MIRYISFFVLSSSPPSLLRLHPMTWVFSPTTSQFFMIVIVSYYLPLFVKIMSVTTISFNNQKTWQWYNSNKWIVDWICGNSRPLIFLVGTKNFPPLETNAHWQKKMLILWRQGCITQHNFCYIVIRFQFTRIYGTVRLNHGQNIKYPYF